MFDGGTILVGFFAEPWWTGVSALALILTLIVVLLYTKATYRMAKVQEEEIGLRKRPVVAFYCADKTQFFFPTFAHNFSNVHAKVRVLATVELNGIEVKMPANNHYGGIMIWQVQAVGASGPPFQGHLNLLQLVQDNRIEFAQNRDSAKVTIEAWVAGLKESDSSLYDNGYKNPVSHWYWKPTERCWIQEISPPPQ